MISSLRNLTYGRCRGLTIKRTVRDSVVVSGLKGRPSRVRTKPSVRTTKNEDGPFYRVDVSYPCKPPEMDSSHWDESIPQKRFRVLLPYWSQEPNPYCFGIQKRFTTVTTLRWRRSFKNSFCYSSGIHYRWVCSGGNETVMGRGWEYDEVRVVGLTRVPTTV